MTQYELIKSAESLLRVLHENHVNVADVNYIEAFEELCRLEKEGHKKTFIVYYISERFGMDVATLYRIKNRMNKQITIV